ncbi:hypothetical protein FGG08_000259 [Glutinoglossum americanum]|uniref:Peptidase S26 domain-containing protein n=1 Tax=Glutinoglossum americanum TaxID=1670608 RepID=A0A9P8L636_9PEZI|nr:hypothetical protein FGG08_000259 [Glutinoglossum americanum]
MPPLLTSKIPTLFGPLPLRTLLLTTTKLLAFTHLFLTHFLSLKPTTGPSMLPTLSVHNDWILISNLHVRGRGVRVGDCVSLRHPVEPEVGAVKRVVGVGGDFVEVGEEGVIQIPEGHCWVVGDNLPHSRDSRVYGPIPLALIKGKVIGRIWPRPKWITNALQEPAT